MPDHCPNPDRSSPAGSTHKGESYVTREEVLLKIKKLLRLKHGGTPDEIAKAMLLAQQLAEKYGVELDSVDASLDADRHTVKHDAIKTFGRVPTEIHIASNLVKRHFDVDFLILGTR